MSLVLKVTGQGIREQDAPEVRRALALLADPESSLQLHYAPFHKESFKTFESGDLDGMVEWVCRQTSAVGVYYSLGTVSPGLDRNQRDSDIVTRRWFLVDLDRDKDKTPEFKEYSATDAEHEAVRELADEVREYLDGLGWPPAVVVDSGNGFHLLYRVDLPNDKLTKALFKTALYALAERFNGSRGLVGAECHDARRVAKLPGTWARRGPETDDRPHRMCRLLHAPDGEMLTPDLLKKLTAPEPTTGDAWEGPAETPPSSGNLNLRVGGGDAYARKALERECARLATAGHGQLNNKLYASGAAMGNFVGAGRLDADEVYRRLLEAGQRAGCDNPPKDDDTLRRSIEKGKETPRYDHMPGMNGTHQKGGKSQKTPGTDGKSIIYRASTVVPKKVRWMWPGRIPLGKLTTFAGVGGLGKTFVLCDITSRVTTGAAWPDGAEGAGEPGQVIFISGEDDADDTLVPRLIELKADLTRVVFLKTEVQDRFTLRDVDTLREAVRQAGDGVKFIAIDPPTAYLGGADDHKNAELRQLLTPLKTLASELVVAIIFNTHVNKPQGQKVEAMMRVMGSVAWVNAVRAAHMFARDPEDHERRLFVGMKMNIGKEKKGLAYKIVDAADDMGRVEWLGEVDTTADEAVNSTRPKKRGVIASEWLEQFFGDRVEIKASEMWKAKDDTTTLSRNALIEAKDLMGIQARQTSDDQVRNFWVWLWPPDARARWEQAKKREEADRRKAASGEANEHAV
jgi:hypothetical protein